MRRFRLETARPDTQSRELVHDCILVSLGAGTLVLIVSFVSSRAVALPIRVIAGAIRNPRRGALQRSVPLTRGRDELGEAARSVAEFRKALLAKQRLETERQRRRIEFDHLAHHDALTGLGNRHACGASSTGRIGERRGSGLAVLLGDLNGFESVTTATTTPQATPR